MMTYFSAMIGVVAFLGVNIWLERGKKPQWLLDWPVTRILVLGVLGAILSVAVGILTRLMLLPVVVTILVSCMIAWKYREYFHALGK
jgi:hypothetical protein